MTVEILQIIGFDAAIGIVDIPFPPSGGEFPPSSKLDFHIIAPVATVVDFRKVLRTIFLDAVQEFSDRSDGSDS